MNPVVESLTNTQYRIGQYDTFRDDSKRDYLSRQIVRVKLDSQINFLKSTNRPELDAGISKLESMRDQIGHSVPILIEKNSTMIYFKEYQKLIPKRFEFHSRNNVSLTASKRNATDVINALLNYGYTVLAGEIYKFIIDNKMEKEVCMIYTDAVTTTKNLNLHSEKLGDFTLDKQGEAYLLQNGFYRIGQKFRNKGFANIVNDTIEHLEPFEQDGKIKYTFEMLKVGTLKENLLRGTFDNMGKFSTVTRDLDLNADRGRFWIGRLTDVRKKETNYSTPFSFPEFDPDKI